MEHCSQQRVNSKQLVTMQCMLVGTVCQKLFQLALGADCALPGWSIEMAAIIVV